MACCDYVRQATLDTLPKFGYDPAHFTGAVTSGEQANRALREMLAHRNGKVGCVWFTSALPYGGFEEGLDQLEAS